MDCSRGSFPPSAAARPCKSLRRHPARGVRYRSAHRAPVVPGIRTTAAPAAAVLLCCVLHAPHRRRDIHPHAQAVLETRTRLSSRTGGRRLAQLRDAGVVTTTTTTTVRPGSIQVLATAGDSKEVRVVPPYVPRAVCAVCACWARCKRTHTAMSRRHPNQPLPYHPNVTHGGMRAALQRQGHRHPPGGVPDGFLRLEESAAQRRGTAGITRGERRSCSWQYGNSRYRGLSLHTGPRGGASGPSGWPNLSV